MGGVGVWGAFGALALMTTPTADSPWLTVLFFVTMLLALGSVCVLILTLAWCAGGRCDEDHHRMARALRHGALLAVIGVGCALLAWHGYFLWWTAALMASAVLLYEGYVVLVRRAF